MVLIAVAGGTSPTLGHAIVTAISQTENSAVILSRAKADGDQPDKVHGVPVRYVDYTSQQSLVEALKGVHTLISVLKIPGPDWSTHQLSLLSAAQEAGVRRFAPSEFELGHLADGKVDLLAAKLPVRDACAKARAGGKMETTRFQTGGFMNTLGLGVGRKGQHMLHGLVDDPLIWDVARNEAELPVNEVGKSPRITLTEIGDIGRFVAAACQLEEGQWEENMSMVGETVDIEQVVRLIDEVWGEQMDVTTVTREALQKRAADIQGIGSSREEMVMKMHSQLELCMLEEQTGSSILEPVVNRLCPSVRPMQVKEFLEKCWG